MSDYIAPKESGKADWIGGFAVTGGIGERELADEYKANGDDYNAIMAAAIADRLAEAFAEYLHHIVRTNLWGYSNDEDLNYGFDDSKGNYRVTIKDHIAYRYEILNFLGKGSFGIAVKCYDHKNKEEVALKIIKNKNK